MNFTRLFIPAILACTCNALANMFWKMRFDKSPLSITSFKNIIELIFSWKIILGVSCYGISMLIFFYMLSNFKLSAIMPITCMTYIFNLVIAKFVFNESISKIQILGITIVIVGLIVLSRGEVSKLT